MKVTARALLDEKRGKIKADMHGVVKLIHNIKLLRKTSSLDNQLFF
jgi:hypothetical protein